MTEPKVTVRGLRELSSALKAIDPELQRQLSDEAKVVADRIGGQARGRMTHPGGAAAGSVKARKRTAGAAIAFGGSAAPYEPWLDFGGGKKHARGVTPSNGAEGERRPWLGSPTGEGRYVYPAISANKDETAEAVERAVINAARKADFEVRASMARQIVVDIIGDASKFKKATDDATDSATHLGVSFKTLSLGGLAIGAGTAAASAGIGLIANAADMAASAVIDFAVGSIDKASALNEAMTLSQQVFEGNTEAVKEWADGAATAFGESSTEALSFASNFGTAFKNVGMSLDETTDKAETMTRLAADLGSAFDRSSEEAATALRSGLLGESEPLRAFGVFLDEAKVKAQAAAMGMKPLNGALTDGQKVAARYAIIMKQTADSQGMFGRDTNSLADAQKELGAEIDNVQAEIGQQLLPVVRDLTVWARDDLVPAIEEVVEVMKGAAEGAAVVSFALDSIHDPIGAAARAEQNLRDQSDQAFGEAAVKKVEDYVAAHKDLVPAAASAAGAVGDVSGASGTLSGKIGPLKTRVDDLGDSFRTTRDKVNDLSDAFLEAAYAPKQLKLKLESTNLELTLQRRHLQDLKDQYDKHPSKTLEKDIVDLKLQISETTQKGEGLRAKIAGLDGTTTNEVETEIKRVGKAADNAKPEVNDLTTAVNKLDAAAQKASDDMFSIPNVPGGPSSKPRASGGPVVPGGVYTVGEHGPETLIVGSSGYVLPHGSMSVGSRGAGQVININIASFTGSDNDIDHFADRLALRMRLAGA